MNKFAMTLGASAFALSTAVIADVQFADPDEGGIGYEWTVDIEHHGSHEIVGSVGGKGSYEPAFEMPDFGWTHTTDWVALELGVDVMLEIEMTRQEGVYELKVDRETGEKSYVTSGAMLYPAFSIYKGWDTTTEQEKGSFNPIGNFWGDIEYIDAAYSDKGQSTVVFKIMLEAGKYSINAGGVNALHCAETDPCYNGAHGYRMKITASHDMAK